MSRIIGLYLSTFFLSSLGCLTSGKAQSIFPHPHPNAHAHNDYEHTHPLWEALKSGFISVEADVHLKNNTLLVSHNKPNNTAKSLERLYLRPIDSLIYINALYPHNNVTFYLMIDVKTKALPTYRAIQEALTHYTQLLCEGNNCSVKIFISGNRAINVMLKEGYNGIGLDGRPDDLGKNISVERMPVISDSYGNWSTWKGKDQPEEKDLEPIRELALRVHAEGKKLRLWAIPDNERAWSILLDAGVDFINTDRLEDLHHYLLSQDL